MRTHAALVLAMGMLGWSALGMAQTVPPALMVKEGDRSVPLGLSGVRTEVRIFGSQAETTTTLTFANSRPRAMEGDLYFPLPEGATISGYALDVHGVMVDGVAVEKHQARQVFEKIVRQGLDPGLVEWTKGNNFQTRVFPIPANGSRTVRVQYVSELSGGKGQPRYELPLRYAEPVREFSLRIEVVKPAAAPQITQGQLANFQFGAWRDSFVAETKLENARLQDNLVIALPPADQQPVVVEQADDGHTYFAIQDFPAVPMIKRSPFAPRHVVLFWDASGSRATGDRGREINLVRACLEQWLVRNSGSDAKLAVDLVLLRNVAAAPQHFDLTRESFGQLPDALRAIAYDGGTQLGAVGPVPGVAKPDCYLLFTDGLSNFGREEPARLDAPLYAFSSDVTANHPLLHSVAMANGGRYFNLARIDDADVARAVGYPAWSLLSVTAGSAPVDDVFPSIPQPVNGRVSVVGRLTTAEATITLHYGFPGQEAHATPHQVQRSAAVQGTLLKRLWAQAKLSELLIAPQKNEKAITALGKQFNLVTPHTSLMVLETLDQYVENDIAPPTSLPGMREEYLRRVDTLEHQKSKEKADKIATVLRMWDERVKWWNTKFSYPADYKVGGEQAAQNGSLGGAAGMGPAAGRGLPSARPVPVAASVATPMPATPTADAAAATPLRPAPGSTSPRSLADDRPSRRDAAAEALQLASDKAPAKDEGREPGIVIQPWNPDTPYLKDLRAAKDRDPYAVYLKHRQQFGNAPAFFLDCADFFRDEKGDARLSLQVLSNVAELKLEDPALLRVMAHRLAQIGELDLAVQTFEQVLALRPEEPQSLRDLALVLAQRAAQAQRDQSGSLPAICADYARALDLLNQIVLGHWDDRFPEIEVIALEECNRILPLAQQAGVPDNPLDPRLVKLLDVDVRIVMTWQADNTDLDLWVTEPSGEKVYYGHTRSHIGGLISRDFTRGYGPEEYLIHRAMHGMYRIETNFFGSQAVQLLGAVTLQVDVFTNYGRPNQQHKALTIRLKEARDTIRIGAIEF